MEEPIQCPRNEAGEVIRSCGQNDEMIYLAITMNYWVSTLILILDFGIHWIRTTPRNRLRSAIQSKGVKLVVHFGASSLAEIVTGRFFFHMTCHCKYVTSVAALTMKLFSFLLIKAFERFFQPDDYEDRPLTDTSKVIYIAEVFLITLLFDILRVVICAIRWVAFVERVFDRMGDNKIYLALFVPPLIDITKLVIEWALKRWVHRPRVAGAPSEPLLGRPVGILLRVLLFPYMYRRMEGRRGLGF